MKTVSVLIKSFSNQEVVALLNCGNRGDGLIHMGGRELFKQHNVRCNEIRYPAKAAGNVLFVYGNGAFSRAYHHMVDYLEYYAGKFNRIIVLPASFDVSCRRVRNFLTTLPNNTTIYCRERHSYGLVGATVPRPAAVGLDHDLAFHLDFSFWKHRGQGRLLAFRTDAERPSNVVITDNNDVSKGNETMGESFLNDVSQFEEVHTNRTHVAIAAAMMGKRTYVYPSSYHKQKAIYQYSLAHLPNVSWVESTMPVLN